ncbi:MAG: preprotein translocase subunit SecE [Coriobacteriia bacterium]|nr:preprotein translocase subunit SecE [Coriobacteriia bacterium]
MAQGGKAAKPNISQRLAQYLRDVRAEMRRVVWPNRAEVTNSSVVVITTLLIFVIMVFVTDQVVLFLVNAVASIGR